MRRLILKTAYLASLVALSFALAKLSPVSVAAAGEYHVYSCRTPTGEVAPVDGWTGAAGSMPDDYAKDTCADGGSLLAALGDESTHVGNVFEATWTLAIPVAERMVGATLWRVQDADGASGMVAAYATSLSAPGPYEPFDWCTYYVGCPTGEGSQTEPFASANRVVVPSADLGSHIYLETVCEGFTAKAECPADRGDNNGYAAAIYLYAADIVLTQDEGPVAKEVSGPLATEQTVQGTSDLLFNASDPGSGVWETTFNVDGRVVQTEVPDEDGGRCRNVGQSTDGLPAFLYLQPCPPVESVDVGLNTAALSNGQHHLVVSVLDPAGNSAAVLDRTIDVQNGPPATPALPAKPAPKRRARARVTLSIAPHRVSGRGSIHIVGGVLGGHIPKDGKKLLLEGRLGGGKWSQFELLRTGRHGRFHANYPSEFLGPGRWQIRVVCQAQAGYPFATGTSRVVGVRVL